MNCPNQAALPSADITRLHYNRSPIRPAIIRAHAINREQAGVTFPPIEPFATGHLPVGDGDEIYWEASGNRDGKPALYLHGGPGSGVGTGYRRNFDPDQYLIVSFDQRGCGRSRPLVSDPTADLSTNTTQALISDIEALRNHFGVERW